MSDDNCPHCGAWWDEHGYEHLARYCYPGRIEKLEAALREIERECKESRPNTFKHEDADCIGRIWRLAENALSPIRMNDPESPDSSPIAPAEPREP